MEDKQVDGEILVVPFFGQGHLFPCMELCKHFASSNYKAVFIIPSHLSSSVPSTFRQLSLIEVIEIPNSSSPPPEEIAAPVPPPSPLTTDQGPSTDPGPGSRPNNPFQRGNQQLSRGIESVLSERYTDPGVTRPGCAVVDAMMSWSKEVFCKFGVPTVSFSTSGACNSAMEYAAWKAHGDDIKPDESRVLPGLPEDMALTYSDINRKLNRGHGFGRGGPGGMRFNRPRQDGPMPPDGMKLGHGRPDGPPPGRMNFGPGKRPKWLDEVEGSVALLINTCDELEGPFLKYLAIQIQKPVFGVGPMLPEKYWKSAGSIIHDREIRSNRESNYTEDEVLQWLDSKPHQSVIYISFGSEVGPTMEEYGELAEALGELKRPFIWVIQPNTGKPGPPPGMFSNQPAGPVDSTGEEEEASYYPHGLEEKVGENGMIIKGWAPQLLILSHPSLGGFLSHCGWNSTTEALGRGVPILAWPIRGDQFFVAKMVVNHLKVGYSLPSTGTEIVKKDVIKSGVEKLMSDEEVRKRAATLKCSFEKGFPASSVASINSFLDLVAQSPAIKRRRKEQ